MNTIAEVNNENINKNNFKSKSSTVSFTQQNVQLNNSPLLFPAGFETLFLALYVVFLPYLAGLLFLFTYVSKGNIDVFASLNNESSFLFAWCIGYECLAVITLLLIMKSAIRFSTKNLHDKPKVFMRP